LSAIGTAKIAVEEQGQRLTDLFMYSYNRYLAVASRVVRRSLKEEKRLVAEKRGEQELRFAKWTVCLTLATIL